MKLSRTEIKLVSDLSAKRRRRKRDAWWSFLTTIGLAVAVLGYEIFPSLGKLLLLPLPPLLTVLPTVYFIHLIHVYFAVRPEDKLIRLLQRYLDRDAEAIVQISNVAETDDVAAWQS